MKWDEQRDMLLAKAADDARSLAILAGSPESSDAAVGFHAQQAVEKLLKAMLCHHHVKYKKTHDLTLLFDLLLDSGVSIPVPIEDLVWLQPYAVQLRYDDVPIGTPVALDRMEVQQAVQHMRAWVDQSIADTHDGE